jgi:sugar lactone lactonase YvrE
MAWEFEKVAGPYKGRTGGLAWDGKGMLVSAVAEECVYRYDPASGKADVFRKYTGRVNGLAVMKDCSVLAAQEGGRRVIHFLKDGSTAPTEELLDGRDHHNQPVDVIVDSKGRAWVADPWNAQPPYGPPAFPFLDHASVLLLESVGPRQWRLTRVTHDTGGPRAVLLSQDEKTLYVADGDVERGNVCQLFAYPVIAGGEVGHAKPLLVFTAVDRGIEGMCLDSEGNIIACAGWRKGGAGPMVYVISPSGTILESHPAPADMPMRCAFGDAGLSSLYVTAGDGGLYRAKNTGRKGLAR